MAGVQPAFDAPPPAKPLAVARATDLVPAARSIAFVVIALFVYFWITTDAFFTSNNLRVVTQFTTAVAMLAIAQVMNLVGGEIDLSLGNVYALTPFIMFSAQDWGLPLPVALVFAVIVAALVGLTNGVITLMTGVPSFITTLGMLFFLNGLTLTISDGFPKPAPRGGFAEWIAVPTSPVSGRPWGSRSCCTSCSPTRGGVCTPSPPAATRSAPRRPAS